MDDDAIDPKDLDEEDENIGEEDDFDDTSSKKKSKKPTEDDSLDALADEEDEALPDDAFDDVEPEDMW